MYVTFQPWHRWLSLFILFFYKLQTTNYSPGGKRASLSIGNKYALLSLWCNGYATCLSLPSTYPSLSNRHPMTSTDAITVEIAKAIPYFLNLTDSPIAPFS